MALSNHNLRTKHVMMEQPIGKQNTILNHNTKQPDKNNNVTMEINSATTTAETSDSTAITAENNMSAELSNNKEIDATQGYTAGKDEELFTIPGQLPICKLSQEQLGHNRVICITIQSSGNMNTVNRIK